MTVFKRTLLAEDGVARVETECLGDNTGQYATKHIGALVKMGANAYVAPSQGDDIVGQVVNIEVYTANDGFSVGAVKKDRRIEAEIGANQSGNMAVGDLVVADAQPALSVGGLGHVKTGVAVVADATVGTPVVHKWECIWISGAGATGDTVILQKV